MHLCLGICACINEPSQAHINTHACLEAREMRDMKFSFFFLDTIFIVMLVYIFLGHCVVHLLLLGCVATHAFLWDIF